MTYGRRNLRLKHIGRGVFEPVYLSSLRDRGVVEAVIGFYEDWVGKCFGDVRWDDLRVIVGDDRVFNGLRKVMSYFYRPKPVGLRTVVNPRMLGLKFLSLLMSFTGASYLLKSGILLLKTFPIS